jgi:hypothetical protein
MAHVPMAADNAVTRVIIADDGKPALAVVRDQAPEIAVDDLHRPGRC